MSMSLQAGQIVAEKYRIVRLLGQGGMGEVYEGENTRIRRRVAIKTLLAGVASRTDVVQRFEREAQAAGRIGSEHIVEVLDLGDLPDGSRYMVMEFLEGATLSERIVSRGRLPPREAARIVIELCEGLAAAHQAGIIHRDLKPANVFLLTHKQNRFDFVKILDFGVSKFSVLADEMSMTRTGAVVGTPYYMSPEQAKGAKSIDGRSDLYSVGVILYETITGQVPFNAQTFNELIFKIALESPLPPESFVPDLDPAFASLVRKAMAREPNERFQSAVEFKQALETWANELDRASVAGQQAAAQGAFLPAPGFPRNGGTMMLAAQPPWHEPAAPTAVPPPVAAPIGPQVDPRVYPAVVAPAPPKASSGAFVPVMVAIAFAVVTATVAIGYVILKRPSMLSSKPAASVIAGERATASETPTAAPSERPASTERAVAIDDLPSPSASTRTAPLEASAPPAASIAGSPHPTPPHEPALPSHVSGGTASPPQKPTAKPTPTGRSITGDL